jgi:triosephosphate isomerase (TIM)
MRQLIAGNWKMNGVSTELVQVEALARELRTNAPQCDVLVCPPATLISRAVQVGGADVMFGGQDCHAEASGSFTGDVSAEMLRDAGAQAVIVGHSERRRLHGETDSMVAAKTNAAWRAGLVAIVCVGETIAERESGKADAVCEAQLSVSLPTGATPENTAVAYEPVWAIGTGMTPTSAEICAMHAHIRAILGSGVRILYGGSVNAENAGDILRLRDVGGALVGGASLRASDFLKIVRAAHITS